MHKIMFVALCALSFWCAAVQAVPATEAKGKNEEKAYTVDGRSGLTLADPFVLYENGVYYAYGTHAADGIELYTSRDMRHWTFYGLALDRKNSTATRGFWAPEIYHIGSLYYMYFTGNERLFCATSTSPVGPFIQRGGCFLQEGSIDGSLFRASDGKYYFYFVRFNHGNEVWMAEMREDLTGIKPETMHFCIRTDQPWETDPKFPYAKVNEGPFVIEKGGRYIMTYSGNDFRSKNYGVGEAVALRPEGPWKKLPDNPIFQRAGGLAGTGHHAFFKDSKGRWQMAFHAHASDSVVSPRCTYFVSFKMKKGGDGIYRPRFSRHVMAPVAVGNGD